MSEPGHRAGRRDRARGCGRRCAAGRAIWCRARQRRASCSRSILAPCVSGSRAACPSAMVPAAFVVLEALPLTRQRQARSGGAARAPRARADGRLSSPRARPRSSLLCEIVAELLGLERVGIADNFFHLGGHSLLAVRLAAQVRDRLGRESAAAHDLRDTGARRPRPRPRRARAPRGRVGRCWPIRPPRMRPFPLTPVQQAYWLGRQQLVELGEVACHAYAELSCATLDLERLDRRLAHADRSPSDAARGHRAGRHAAHPRERPARSRSPLTITVLLPATRPGGGAGACARRCRTRYCPPTGGRCSRSA